MHSKQELQQKRAQRAAEVQQIAEEEVVVLRHAGKVGRKKLPKSSPTSPTDVKAKNTGMHYSGPLIKLRKPIAVMFHPLSHKNTFEFVTRFGICSSDSNVNMVADLDEVTNLRAASPAGSICRGSQCSQVSSRNKLVLIQPAVKINKH